MSGKYERPTQGKHGGPVTLCPVTKHTPIKRPATKRSGK
jgi:hypothetical protein